MKLFVTGAAGFIGSNYVRYVLGSTDHEVTIYDALTYAGNLESIRDVLDDTALRLRPRRHLRARRRRAGDGRPRRGRPLRRREPRRPVDPGRLEVRAHELHRHQRAVRRGQHRRRRQVPAHLDRRGVRIGRGGFVGRDRRPRAALAVLGGQGRLRPDRLVVLLDVRPAGGRRRAAPTTTGPISSPRRSSRCSPRTCSTASRCRCTATGSTCATGSTSRTTTSPPTSCSSRGTPARSTTSAPATS